jgi:pimeloyl-ACP methyl ester carboxylesterase
MMPEIELTQGVIRYRDLGLGAPVVLIHGLLVNGTVWDRVVPLIAANTRCIVPELPLGSHSLPMREDADLSPPALAALIAELIERLELEDVTLVGNDTGGALCQLVAARHPERLGQLVLTNCDAFENFPPPAVRPMLTALKLPGVIAATALLARLRPVRKAMFSAMPLTMETIPDELVKSWVAPLASHGVRRDLARVVRGISPSHTLAAVELLRSFDRPTLIAWGERDRFFPQADAESLAATFPRARLELIPDARAFVQLDAPERLAKLIGSVADGAVTAPA